MHLPQNPHVLIINEGMKPVLTGSCQLQVTPEQVAAIEATLKAFAEACDYVNGKVKPNPMEELAIQSLRSSYI
ncbi:MAG: hypothetical protein PX481_20995 [Microcystis sp. M53603_WE2]|nr:MULTISPECIES: hypothetical protein [unclassified Microcystis]MCE2663771.1 hypothetical protein [Microcystis sp. 53602_E8]MDJ0530821.1 hypothetical protein [Microcystis sp. M53600_WE12]MDJ0541101.1 hypothetical protein [Microcystis sp. M53603_WE2]MDJ0604633.1 hypothetical protein [Microcystis sp. M53602_WE12]